MYLELEAAQVMKSGFNQDELGSYQTVSNKEVIGSHVCFPKITLTSAWKMNGMRPRVESLLYHHHGVKGCEVIILVMTPYFG